MNEPWQICSPIKESCSCLKVLIFINQINNPIMLCVFDAAGVKLTTTRVVTKADHN